MCRGDPGAAELPDPAWGQPERGHGGDGPGHDVLFGLGEDGTLGFGCQAGGGGGDCPGRDAAGISIPDQGRWLASALRGHYNYYAVPDNGASLRGFRWRVTRHWLRALRRRSQRTRRLNWKRMDRLADRWLPQPRILHP